MTNTDPVPNIPRWTLGDRLQKALDHAEVSREEMADYLGYSAQALGYYINGKRSPKIALVRQWAFRCGVDFEWLWTGEVSLPRGKGPRGAGKKLRGWDSNPEPSGVSVISLRPLIFPSAA